MSAIAEPTLDPAELGRLLRAANPAALLVPSRLLRRVIKHDRNFAAAYSKQDVEQYKLIVAGMTRGMFDRDTAPGAEAEDLLRLEIPALIVPGRDAAHATSAARYLEECLPQADYWDVPVAGQTEATVPPRIIEFLAQASAAAC